MALRAAIALATCVFLPAIEAGAYSPFEASRAFWERVHCIEIDIYLEIDVDDTALQAAAESTIAARLLTVWRREMPEHSLVRSLTSADRKRAIQAMLPGGPGVRGVGCPIAAFGASRQWIPTLKIFVKAASMGTGDRAFGFIRASFEMESSQGTAFNNGLKFYCEPPGSEALRKNPYGGTLLFGPAYQSGAEYQPIFALARLDMSFFVLGGSDSHRIFANYSKVKVAEIAAEAGEELVKKIATSYYEAKSMRK